MTTKTAPTMSKEVVGAQVNSISRVKFSQRDFSAFSMALGGAFNPNPALKSALMEAKKLVHRE